MDTYFCIKCEKIVKGEETIEFVYDENDPRTSYEKYGYPRKHLGCGGRIIVNKNKLKIWKR